MHNIRIIKPLSIAEDVESCELGLSVCSAAHAAEVGDCEVSAVYF